MAGAALFGLQDEVDAGMGDGGADLLRGGQQADQHARMAMTANNLITVKGG